MTYRYYGQNVEDFLLWEFFDRKPQGFFVDIGAFDGQYLSNTLSFEEQGWTGICIEPLPFYFEQCQKNRPRSICIQAACVGDASIESIQIQSDKLGVYSGVSVDETEIEQSYRNRGWEFEGLTQITVPAYTLNQVLDEHLPHNTPVDFISIDVEGVEIEVLSGLDLGRYAPRVLVMEANNSAEREKLNAYLVDQQGYYEARQIKQNIFYCRTLEDVRKIRSIPLHAYRERTTHPLGETFTFSEQKARILVTEPMWQRTMFGQWLLRTAFAQRIMHVMYRLQSKT